MNLRTFLWELVFKRIVETGSLITGYAKYYKNGSEQNMKTLKGILEEVNRLKIRIEWKCTIGEMNKEDRVKNWSINVENINSEVRKIEQEVKESNFLSRAHVGKLVDAKIVEAQELVQKGKPVVAEEKSFKYIVLGGGVAAVHAAREFTNQGLKPGELAIISKEAVPPYDRSELSKSYLLPRASSAATLPSSDVFVGAEWYREKGIELILTTEIANANLASKTLTSAAGRVFRYQTLIIANGSAAAQLDVQGAKNASNIFYLREIWDADQIVRTMREKKKLGKAVVIGGGYIGFEVGAALRLNGFDVRLVYRESRLMHHIFTPAIASFYEGYYENRGIKLFKNTVPVGFKSRFSNSNDEVTAAVELNTGQVLEADIVVVGVEAKPRISLFEGQVKLEKGGIKTYGCFRTSVADVYAVGDVATFPFSGGTKRVEHIDHARESAKQAVMAIKQSEDGKFMTSEYDFLPCFSCRSFDLSWRFCGDNVGEELLFGEDMRVTSTKPKFITYWYSGGKVVGAFLEGGSDVENRGIERIGKLKPEVKKGDLAEKRISFAAEFGTCIMQ